MSATSQSSSVGDEKIVSKVEVTQSHQQLEHQLSTFKSINGHTINVVRSQDRQLALEQLGYKQELDRSYTYYDLFGVAFSIMGLLPSICAIFTQSTSAGASSSWGWLFTSFCGILPVGIALAELGSAFPSASAVYLSAWKFAPEKYKDVCAYSVCVLDSIALSAGACSVFFSCSGQILSCVQVSNTGFEATHARKYGVYAACIILGAFIGSFSGKISVRIQQIAIYFNMFLLVLVFIALPIGTKRNNIPFNDGKFIFGNAENYSNWSTGGNWILNALVPAAWTISAFDSPIHMSEEAVYNPRNMKKHVLLDPKASPAAFGIIMSISACGLLGWLMLICIYACMGPSVDAIMGSSYNNILTQVFMNSLGKKWTLAIMSLMSIGCFLMGVSAIMATSRNFYALCRDRVLPPIPADWLAVVNTKTNTPVRAMYGTCIVSMLLGLLIFQDQGANSLFTIAVAGFYMALAIPMFLKITYARKFFDKGPFFLGNKTSYIINLIAVGYQGFMIVLMMVPSVNHPNKQGMNYTVVFTFGILAMALSGFYLFMHKYFKGPRSNLSDQEYLEAVGEDAGIDAILSSEPKSE